MEWLEKLENLKKQQQRLMTDIDTLIQTVEADKAIIEQLNWRQLATEQEEEIARLREELVKVTREKDALQRALNDQMFAERCSLIASSKERMTAYFQSTVEGTQNRLIQLEAALKQRVNQLKLSLSNRMDKNNLELQMKVSELEAEIGANFRQQTLALNQGVLELSHDLNEKYTEMADEKLTPEMLEKRVKQNQWELKLGLNLLNKVGILFILLGMSAMFKFSFDHWMSDYLKGISFFSLGALFLVSGEWCYRRKKESFAIGVIGGGLAILYGSLFYSCFLLKILGMDPGFLLAILITGVATLFSLRYRSQVIAGFALIGGYLPFISYIASFGLPGNMYFALIIYLILLNLLLLGISFWKNWTFIKFLSFVLNIPALCYLVFNMTDLASAIVYTGFVFLMYLTVTLVYPVFRKTVFRGGDLVLLGLNTLVNCLIVYLLFDKGGWNEYRGILAIGFCLIYSVLGRLVQKKIPGKHHSEILFYGTALTFAILAVPFQFGVKWLIMGWLVEAMILVFIGTRYHQKPMEVTGWLIFLGCIGLFYQFDLVSYLDYGEYEAFFGFKYLALTVSQILLLGYYLYLKTKGLPVSKDASGSLLSLYKYLVIGNVWFYLLITGWDYLRAIISSFDYLPFYQGVWLAMVSLCLSTAIHGLKSLHGTMTRLVGGCFSILAAGTFFYLNFSPLLVRLGPSGDLNLKYISLVLLLITNVLVFMNFRSWASSLVEHRRLGLEQYPLVLGLYLLTNITGIMSVQFGLELSNLIFSLVYLVFAVGFIVYGFWRKYISVRRIGLALTFLAMAKLFIYDLACLEALGKIIAYFTFGLVLLAISYIYQRTVNSLEGKRDEKQETV